MKSVRYAGARRSLKKEPVATALKCFRQIRICASPISCNGGGNLPKLDKDTRKAAIQAVTKRQLQLMRARTAKSCPLCLLCNKSPEMCSKCPANYEKYPDSPYSCQEFGHDLDAIWIKLNDFRAWIEGRK